MECPNCGSDHVRQQYMTYTPRERGLENVKFINTPYLICDNCGEKETSIPKFNVVMREIRESLCMVNRRLTGNEISFLRKQLKLSGQECANLLGVSNVSLSRWENDNVRIQHTADNLLRTFTLSDLGLSCEQIVHTLTSIPELNMQSIEIDLANYKEDVFAGSLAYPLDAVNDDSYWSVIEALN